MAAVVQPCVKLLFSPDLADLERDSPEDPERFCVLVQALIGTDPTDHAADTFDLLVCSPDQVPSPRPGQALTGRATLVLARWDVALVRRMLERWCAAARAPSWEQAAAFLCRYLDWEYDPHRALDRGPPGT